MKIEVRICINLNPPQVVSKLKQKTKIFCIVNDTDTRKKETGYKLDEMFINHIFNKGCECRIYKELPMSNSKEQTSFNKIKVQYKKRQKVWTRDQIGDKHGE